MKIAVTSVGRDLLSDTDPRFGRAAYFIMVNPDTMAFEVVENQQNIELPQGAGIQAGKTLIDHGANALITGFCGPKAFHLLQRAGVKVMTCGRCRVTDAITKYKNHELDIITQPNQEGHWV